MPPKKQPSKLATQGSVGVPAAPPAPSSRQPLPPPVLPPSESLPPLWKPTRPPSAVFPEWPASDSFAPEHWHSFDAPFEDPLQASELPLPYEVADARGSIQWRRPCEFLPPIVDPTPPAPPPPLPAVHADAKNAKKAAAAPPKKPEAADKRAAAAAPPVPAPPRHAHVFYVDTKTTSDRSAPDPLHQAQHHLDCHIPRDFRRLWSAEQLDSLEQWRKEEARVQVDKQRRERVHMAFEDAIAYIVNERPRGMLDDVEIDPDDLIDDCPDDEHDEEHLNDGAGGSDASPWGVLPPSPIEIHPNTVLKPETPLGEVVHADMASYFRIVETLFNVWKVLDPTQSTNAHTPQFLWRAIYPQDARGVPAYNPGGKYSVKLFVLGKWRKVDIDDRLPVDASGKIVYATSSMRSEIWPALLTKALLKAMQWLQVIGGDDGDESTKDDDSYATRVTAQVLLLLTGWKISRWHPGTATSFSENVYHQLLPFVPQQQQHDPERADARCSSTDDDPVQDNTGEQPLVIEGADVIDEAESPPTQPREEKSTLLRTPLALVCCSDASSATVGVLRYCEAAMLVDIVGDAGNTTFKIIRHGSPVNISEDATSFSATANALMLLLAHPPPVQAASTVRTWTEVVSDASHQLVPFDNPPVEFALVKLLEKKKAVDNGQEDGNAVDEDDETHPSVVATLTPVQPSKGSQDLDSPTSSSTRAVAKLLRFDPRGSVSLIEEPITNDQGSPEAAPPALVTLHTTSSSHLDLAQVKGPTSTTRAFRIVPQRALVRYGYCLEIESSSVASIQLVDAAGLWRALGHLHVEETHGTYPVMLSKTWNVLVQTVVTIDPMDGGDAQASGHNEVELRVDLHVADAEIARFVHVSVVNNATNNVLLLPMLCCTTKIPVIDPAGASAFTIIVDCAPGSQSLHAGNWRLAIGCPRKFSMSPTPSSTVSLTTFGGVYEPNRDLILFRDVLTPPVKAVATSFELQVIKQGQTGDRLDRVVQDLAVQLEVFDANTTNEGDEATKPVPLAQARGKGSARLLQLPRPATASPTSRFILQAAVDRSACEMPSALQSRRPFRNNTAQPPLSSDVSAVAEEAKEPASDEVVATEVKTSTPFLQWRLRCWSAEEVKVDVDRAKELRHEAIRARWAEQARDRETSGAASRLLFLRQSTAAETRLQQEQSLTEERAEALRSRYAWLHDVLGRVEATEHQFLTATRAGDQDVAVVTQQELDANELELAKQLRLAQEQLEARRAARAAAKEQRAVDWKAEVQIVIDERAAASKLRAARRQELVDAATKSA